MITDYALLGREEDGAGETQDICEFTVVRAVESAVCNFNCNCFLTVKKFDRSESPLIPSKTRWQTTNLEKPLHEHSLPCAIYTIKLMM